VSRKFRKGIIRDLEWKNTFIKKAKKHQRDVLPVFISGRNTDRFYNLANLRKKFGIKANIEMFFLVDEMMKQKGKTINIIFGDIIPWNTFDQSRSEQQWAEYVKQRVYELG
jgi:putative hemolysin